MILKQRRVPVHSSELKKYLLSSWIVIMSLHQHWNLFLKVILLLALFPQMMSEKVGGAEGTKLDEDFKELERVITA